MTIKSTTPSTRTIRVVSEVVGDYVIVRSIDGRIAKSIERKCIDLYWELYKSPHSSNG